MKHLFCTGAKTPSGKKVTVGLLARLETNVKAQAFRLAVRAAYPQVGLAVAAVMQKEVRTQRLTTLLQTVSNPMLAPFIKIPNLMRELAIAQDIDPDSLVNDVSEAQIFAEMLKGLANAQQAGGPENQPPSDQQGSLGQLGDASAGADPNDASGVGGGQIGTGSVPAAGEDNFTGNA